MSCSFREMVGRESVVGILHVIHIISTVTAAFEGSL